MTTNTVSGYSHALFSNGTYLRKYAQEADKKENGGNENGVIDGNEIQKFKRIVKSKTGYDFNFQNLKQVKNKSIRTQDDNGKFIFNTTMDIANKYGNSATTKTIDWMNGKESGHDLLVPSRKILDIPYMNDNDYKSSLADVEKQEAEVKKRVEKQNADKKAKEEQEYHENCKSTLQKGVEAFVGWIRSL